MLFKDHHWSKPGMLGTRQPISLSALTVFASCVEALNVVIEADSYGGEGHLSLQAGHQAIIERARPLCPHHGADGPKHAPVANVLGSVHRRLLPLNLNTKQNNIHVRELLGEHMRND